MTRKDLIDRLKHIDNFAPTVDALRTLIADIEADGVVDQPPPAMSANELTLRLEQIANSNTLRGTGEGQALQTLIEDIRLGVRPVIDAQAIRERGFLTLDELSAMTLQDIATFSR